MPDTFLTRAQQKTIENLLECRTIAQAAERSEVSERTIYRWFKQRPFRLALNEARRNAFALSNIRLQVLADQAPDLLEKIIHDRYCPNRKDQSAPEAATQPNKSTQPDPSQQTASEPPSFSSRVPENPANAFTRRDYEAPRPSEPVLYDHLSKYDQGPAPGPAAVGDMVATAARCSAACRRFMFVDMRGHGPIVRQGLGGAGRQQRFRGTGSLTRKSRGPRSPPRPSAGNFAPS